MHNAIAILAACAALEINRILGWLLVLFAALIFIGSIHLGWHYALDGVVAAIVSIGLWISSAALLRRYERRSQQRPNDPGNGRRASDQQPPADDSPVCACSSVSA
jgi:membrane protein implicated in regulation of membrane protease activity